MNAVPATQSLKNEAFSAEDACTQPLRESNIEVNALLSAEESVLLCDELFAFQLYRLYSSGSVPCESDEALTRTGREFRQEESLTR